MFSYQKHPHNYFPHFHAGKAWFCDSNFGFSDEVWVPIIWGKILHKSQVFFWIDEIFSLYSCSFWKKYFLKIYMFEKMRNFQLPVDFNICRVFFLLHSLWIIFKWHWLLHQTLRNQCTAILQLKDIGYRYPLTFKWFSIYKLLP